MISNKNTTIEILNRYGLFAKKKFGQNFLIDSNIVKKIVNSASIDKKTGVIEIGPGIGAMTEILSMEAGKVLCYEIDPDMVNILNDVLKADNIKIINQDFLKVDLDKDFDYFTDMDKIVVVSNLPYYITTPIIFKLLGYSNKISSMYFMVQKEVCSRLSAKEGSRDYGSLSVYIKLNGEAKQEFIVTRNCFYPAPNVDSAVVRIDLYDKPKYEVKDEKLFRGLIKAAFEMRRKTLLNALVAKYSSYGKEKLQAAISALGLGDNVRGERLSTEDFANLANILSK